MTMGTSQAVLAQLWLYAFLLGVGLGAAYDTIRITRVFLGVSYSRRMSARLECIRLPLLSPRKKKRIPKPLLTCAIALGDFLFCIIAGVALILLFYYCNNGKFRFHAVLCTAAGFGLYRVTLGRLVMLFSELIAFVLLAAWRYLCFFIGYPFYRSGVFLLARWRKLLRFINEKKMARERFVATRKAILDLKKDACGLLPQRRDRTEMKNGGESGKEAEEAI